MKVFTKLMAAFALLAFLAVPLGMRGQTRTEVVAYTLDGTITGGSNGYATESEITQDGITWMVTGNTTENPWRIGGKNLTSVDRPMYSTGVIEDNVTKVVITNGTVNLTVNSLTLIVSPNADFSDPTSTIEGGFEASSTTTFERPEEADWTNQYFKLVYNVTNTLTNSNRFAQFVKAEFYKEGGEIPANPEIQIAAEELALPYTANEDGFFNVTYTDGFEAFTASAALYNDEELTEEFDGDWILVEEHIENDTITYMVGENNSTEPRTVYMYVEAMGLDETTIISAVFPVTQAAAPQLFAVNFTLDSDATFVPNEVFTDVIVELEAGTYALPSATKEGFTFDGWDDGATTYAGGTNYTVSDDVDFTAQWTEIVPSTGTDVTFDATVDLGNTSAGEGSIVKDGVTFYCSNGILGNGSEYRIYKNATVTFSVTSGTITNIEFTCTGGNPASGFETVDGFTTNGNNGTWTGSAESVTFTASNKQVRATQIVVPVDNGGTPVPSITAENVSIDYNAVSGEIEYTINNGVDGGTLTASTNDTWLTLGTVDETVPFTCSANETAAARTATVTLTYTYGDSQTATKNVTVTQAGDPNVLDNISDITEVGADYHVKGMVVATSAKGFIICDGTGFVYTYLNATPTQQMGEFVQITGTTGSYNHVIQFTNNATIAEAEEFTFDWPEYTVITEVPNYTEGYHLSDYFQFEGTLTKTTNGSTNYFVAVGEGQIRISYPTTEQATDLDDLLNKTVRIHGFFTGYASNVFTAMMESYEEVVNTDPSITIATYELNVDAGEQNGTINVTYANVDLEMMEVVMCDANGDAAEYDWIPVCWLNEDHNINYQINANEGEARTAYLKVCLLEEETLNPLFCSDIVTINQDAPEAPFEPATYTLATSIESGKQYIIVGMKDDNAYAMGEQRNSNRGAVIVSQDGNTVTVVNDNVYEFVIESSGDNYTIHDARTPGYLYAASGSANQLKTQVTNDDNGVWSISIDDDGLATVEAQGTNSRKSMRFNYNSGNALFSCYVSSSSMPQVYFYVRDEEAPYTYSLTINGYGESTTGGYYLIASPINNVQPVTVDGMTVDAYDLYAFDQTEEDEWRNFKASAFKLETGKGYLYANSDTVTLTFTGKFYTGNGQVALTCDENASLKGWNLIGNPYSCSAALNMPFYRLNEDGSELNASTESNNIAAMEGVFVYAYDEMGEPISTATFADLGGGDPSAPGGGGGLGPEEPDEFILNVIHNNSTVIDRAIVCFGNGKQLPKFQLNPNSTKIYFTQDTKDYAIVRSANQGEMPVNFKAAENGTYSLSVNAESMEMNYLHLIDNMTGADIDLLQTPNYTFEASTTDYASRFRIVFSATESNSTSSESFAYFNGSTWTVSNIGEATLQVVDMMGRVLSSKTVSGNAEINVNQTAGVYMLRLVNGENVRTQKIVVK